MADPLLLVYVVAFGAAAVACFAGASRTDRLEDADVRRGLTWLLLASGGWASAHVGFLVAPTPGLQRGFYLAGLVVGIAAVGPWLYFCSAYTGRSLHRDPTVRRAAVALFVAVLALKLTNPLHGLYFSTQPTATPFPHLAVTNGLLHWMVMGLAYALAVVGYFMLFELFTQVGQDARPLAVLAALTGLPVVLDVLGLVSPLLVDITYEPLGVAVFAVGTLFVYEGRFRAVQLAGSRSDPVIVLTDDGRIRDHNPMARAVFPELDGRDAIGSSLSAVLPELADADVIERELDGERRFYRVNVSPFSTGGTSLGELVTLVDVTAEERSRREIERQNDRLEGFASVVSHDLRSPLNVAMGHLDLARTDGDDEHLAQAATALERMETLIEDLLTLARTGQPIDEPEPVSLGEMAEASWSVVETPAAALVVDGDLAFEADPDRLRQLLENCFRNAVVHAGPEVTVRVEALDGRGFAIEDDGPGIPPEEREAVLESGFTTAEDGTGFGLAIVAEVAEAHGWSLAVVEGDAGGARFEFTGVTPATA